MPFKKKNLLKEWWNSKAFLQIFSVLVAISIWALVNSGQIVQQRRTIKIQYVQLPKGLVFQRNPVKEIRVDLSGSVYRLRSIKDDDLVYRIDLSAGRAGANRFEIDSETLRLPLDVEAEHVNPRNVVVYLEEIFIRTVPVKITPIGAPKPGFQIFKTIVNPDKVSVSGPQSVVSKLDSVDVDLPVLNRDSSFSETLKPKSIFTDVQILDSVLVEVEIARTTTRKQFEQVPVALGDMMKGELKKSLFRVSPGFGRVVLEGPENELRVLERRISIVVPHENLKRGRYRLRGTVMLPQGIKLISIDPESYLVEILSDPLKR